MAASPFFFNPMLRRLSTRPHLEDRRWPGWQVVIGIETHAQIKSRHKLFSDSLTSTPDSPPNTHLSPFDAAFPGTLPRLNPKCVDLALRTALALHSRIQRRSSFDRKHYFYPDLPAGYQITQQYAPIALGGSLTIHLPSSPPVPVRIKQIQLEQDTAKSTFIPRLRTSLIDLNRAGNALMEIVTEPDLRSPEEAGAYVRALQALLRAVGSSDGNMEQGSLRCDVNVSINRVGEPHGTRCEIKNLNSVKFMQAAIISEITRHLSLLNKSPPTPISQETRGFNEHTFETFRLRSKEDAPDYRYMPDPNLGILRLSQSRIDEIERTLPALPAHTRARLQEIYALSHRDTEVLLALDAIKDVPLDGDIPVEQEKDRAPGRMALCKVGGNQRLTHELIGQLTARKETFAQNTVRVEQLGELIDLVQEGKITAYTIHRNIRKAPPAPPPLPPYPSSVLSVAESLQLLALSEHKDKPEEEDEVVVLCRNAIAAMEGEVADYKKGHKGVFNKIVGGL
ncbi:GatB/GatE catalytic domain-containing protein [Cyathus striatus]|nr:GatB/GatE catalytic domain-containing protein [Cyathus striatus]